MASNQLVLTARPTVTHHPGTTQARPLRILHVTPRYFPLMGGVESHVAQVSRLMAQAGADVTILTTDPWGRWPRREQAEGVKIERVRAWPANRDYYFAPGLFAKIRSRPWDIIHLQSYHTLVAPVAMLAALGAQVPYVVTFHAGGHTSAMRNAMRGVQLGLLRPLLAQAKRLVALTPSEAASMATGLRLPPKQFVIIPNGADLPRGFVPAPAAPGRPATLIASVGRLERYKGHHRLIAALPDILREVPEARVWLAGVGSYEGELRQLAQTLGVSERVEIRAIPPTDRLAMAQGLAQAALVVLLSEFETQPIAALEALALGRPLLVADAPGLSDLAARGWARSTPLSSTPAEVAAAVVQQLRDPLVPHNLELPSWEQCAAALLALYQDVLN